MSKFCTIVFLSLLVARQMTGSAQSLPGPSDTTITGPRTFAMIVGISKYKYVNPLTYADKDAEMFRSFLQSPAGGNIPDDHIFCLLNEQAEVKAFFVDGFKWLKSKSLHKGDRLFIYLAGHGDAIDDEQCFFLAYDCNPAGDRNNYLVGGTISLWNVKTKIYREVSKGIDVYFIMDACRSHEPIGGFLEQSFSQTEISGKGSEITMLATGAGTSAIEASTIGSGHGLFTYYLVDGLMGSADTDSNYIITFEEIQRYINDNVSSVAMESFRHKQRPYMSINENPRKIVNVVDSVYYKKWANSKMRESSVSFGEINDYSTTISYHRRVIEIEPKQVRSYIAVGVAFMEQSILDSAVLYFKAAYELNPSEAVKMVNDLNLSSLKNYKAFHDLLDKYIPGWRKH